MTSTPSVCVVLPVYDGEEFLVQQFESILEQTYEDFVILVRDDMSTDASLSIIERYASQDARVLLLPNSTGRLGPKGSFNLLLTEAADYEYVFCADQDDIWDVNKIEISLTAAQSFFTPDEPGLLFTDFRVVTDVGALIWSRGIAHSFVSHMNSFGIESLLGFDYVWGCTTVASRRLLRDSLPIPHAADNHDYWLALVAASLDSLYYLDVPTMSYRKHATNVTGGVDRASWSSRFRRHIGGRGLETQRLLQRKDDQARVLAIRLQDLSGVSQDTRSTLDAYLRSMAASPVVRIIVERRLGIRRQGPLQDFAHYASLFRNRG